MNVVDRAWLAGLLEGEGCFVNHKQTYNRKRDGGVSEYIRPGVVLAMTDLDIVERAAALMGGYSIQVRDRRGKKLLYGFSAFGPRAAKIMREIQPLMGDRRAAKINELLEAYV